MSPGPRRRPGGDEHSAFEELAVGYALHALEPGDELRFTTHLSSCAACERAVREHVETLGQLAYAAPAADPPPAVLAGIRAAIADDVAAEVTPDAAAGDVAGPADLPAPPGVTGLSAARERRQALVLRRSWALSAAAAVTAVVLGLGTWTAVLHNERGAERERGDRLAATVETLEQDGTRTVRLADFDGNVKAVVIAHGQQMSLVVDGLSPNPEGTAYVLWGQNRSGEVRALSAFDVPQGGLDVLHGMPLQVPVEELTTLMVTHEHSRTPPAQTEQPVLVAGSV